MSYLDKVGLKCLVECPDSIMGKHLPKTLYFNRELSRGKLEAFAKVIPKPLHSSFRSDAVVGPGEFKVFRYGDMLFR